MSDQIADAVEFIGKMGFDREVAKNLLDIVQISVQAGHNTAVEECAKIADLRAVKLRAKAKAQVLPSRQSYFAQAIEARVIADLIRGRRTSLVSSQDGK